LTSLFSKEGQVIPKNVSETKFIDKIDFEYNGVPGFWISKWFADEILMINNENDRLSSMIENYYIPIENEYNKHIKVFNRNKAAIQYLTMALIIITSILLSVVGVCVAWAVIDYKIYGLQKF